MLRERMTVIELSGVYRRGEARHRGRALALALRRLTADDVRLTDEAVDAIIRGYAPKAGCRDPARPSVTTISTSRSTCPGHSSRRPRPTSISVPAMLRERMTVIELSGVYRRGEARHRGRALALALRRLTADDVRLTDEAVDAIIRGYAPKALAGALGALCGKVVRHRAEGDEASVEVTPATVAGVLGAPEPPGARVAGRTGRPGVALGLCRSAAGGGAVVCIEASRMPGSGALTLTGRQEVMRESARTAHSWLRANAGRYGLDPAFHRDTDILRPAARPARQQRPARRAKRLRAAGSSGGGGRTATPPR